MAGPSGPAFLFNFYPRSPCGERLGTLRTVNVKKTFLSTLSLRRATRGGVACYLDNIISIHALLAESDQRETKTNEDRYKFLSTLSLRRATRPQPPKAKVLKISIHALLAESDSLHHDIHAALTDFYPRSPCGERPALSMDSVDR